MNVTTKCVPRSYTLLNDTYPLSAYEGRIISEEEIRQGVHRLDKQGDVLIRVLWEIQTDAIIGVIFGDSDAETYRKEPMDKLLACLEKEKKYKNGKNLHK